MKIMMNRSVADGSPRLLFDYVLKDMKIKIGKPQYHAMMAVQSALKFLELSRYILSQCIIKLLINAILFEILECIENTDLITRS